MLSYKLLFYKRKVPWILALKIWAFPISLYKTLLLNEIIAVKKKWPRPSDPLKGIKCFKINQFLDICNPTYHFFKYICSWFKRKMHSGRFFLAVDTICFTIKKEKTCIGHKIVIFIFIKIPFEFTIEEALFTKPFQPYRKWQVQKTHHLETSESDNFMIYIFYDLSHHSISKDAIVYFIKFERKVSLSIQIIICNKVSEAENRREVFTDIFSRPLFHILASLTVKRK